MSYFFRLPLGDPAAETLARLEDPSLSVVQTEEELSVYAESREILSRILTLVGVSGCKITKLELTDWRDNWQEDLELVQIGPLTIAPEGKTGDIILTPGRSFGIGHHPTTRLCLELIYKHREKFASKHLLDFGMGSGVLGILALKLGAKSCVGIDIDEDALAAARRNFILNGVSEIEIRSDLEPDDHFEVAVINILSETLRENWERISRTFVQDSFVLVSGFLEGEQTSVLQLIGGELIEGLSLDGWGAVLIVLNQSKLVSI